ncbi:hypothetical protein B0A55_05027 [Friedmanniomyces simplex]|uniref:Uncharacterized protein n=1 Tax=Friedmanniomyces simplex TaxID=329884 RepID=A0A4U0XH94_9PEZI|nr:hypothetical protein B0A55_05027 [Friedmanniomyces simplex]
MEKQNGAAVLGDEKLKELKHLVDSLGLGRTALAQSIKPVSRDSVTKATPNNDGVPAVVKQNTATQVQSPKPAMKKDSITPPTCDQHQANITGVTARAAADSTPPPHASAAKKRKAAAATKDVEEEEEEEEGLRDQLVEIELKERRTEVRKKLRELGRKGRGFGGVVDG